MRLLHVTNGRFEEFFDKPKPEYAILSHRWVGDEVSYQRYLQGAGIGPRSGNGYEKIFGFCAFVRRWNPKVEWAWIDTCCIDQTSSAELAEAINSMYSWYNNALACIVYLHDLPPSTQPENRRDFRAFRDCVWFQRGWTLQELLASREMIFCDTDWTWYGSKASLLKQIRLATGIPEHFLGGRHDPRDASVAMRMSWASKRKTTKQEDVAYCLLGLFNVSMSPLYGERERAFMRLQLKIIKRSGDESIFAWKSCDPYSGMLAPSPAAFEDSGRFVGINLRPEERRPYYMTNKGLHICSASDTYAASDLDPSTGTFMGYDTHVLQLGCFVGKREGMTSDDAEAEEMWEKAALTIELERSGPSWYRVNCESLGRASNVGRRKKNNGTYFGRGMQREYVVAQPNL